MPSTTYCPDGILDADAPTPLSLAEPAIIQHEVRTSIKRVLTQIHQQAPSARIVLMGYPLLLTSGDCTVAVTSQEVAWVSAMGTLMRDQEQAAVNDVVAAGVPATFSDPISFFIGHGACAGSNSAINNEVLTRTAGDLPFSPGSPVSQESFHPNITGYGLYQKSLYATLQTLGL
jgi:hypothetical protein